jgi:RNA polymerase sigma-70 factor (ECF subfamily)
MKTRVQRAREQLKDRLLGCCQIDLDSRGGVIAYRTRRGCCDVCGRDQP